MPNDEPDSALGLPEPSRAIFYARCTWRESLAPVLRVILQVDRAEDAIPALALHGLIIHFIEQAAEPQERGFRYRPDGTLLVGASERAERLEVYGPFNDQADANKWIEQRKDRKSYSIIEPDICLTYQRVNSILTQVTFPSSLFDNPEH